ncbi:hypothetical protein, partial [Enterobacter hormaechei]
ASRGLGGTAKGLVKVRGTVDAPQLLADITARGLRWQELTIAQVNVKGDVKSTDQIGGNLDVRVDRISQPGVNISLVQLMLFLCTFGIELHQADIDPRLADAIHPHVQVTANLIGGFHIPFDVDLGDGQLLPAQPPGGDIGQQLRRIDSAAHFYQALRRPAEPTRPEPNSY